MDEKTYISRTNLIQAVYNSDSDSFTIPKTGITYDAFVFCRMYREFGRIEPEIGIHSDDDFTNWMVMNELFSQYKFLLEDYTPLQLQDMTGISFDLIDRYQKLMGVCRNEITARVSELMAKLMPEDACDD